MYSPLQKRICFKNVATYLLKVDIRYVLALGLLFVIGVFLTYNILLWLKKCKNS